MPFDVEAVYRSTRPAVEIDGQPAESLTAGLNSLTIVETTDGLYRCEALFGNWGERDGSVGFLYFDRATLDFGKPFKIKLGDSTLFDGRVMGLEGQFGAGSAPQINVLAEDRLQDLRMTRRTRTFADVTDADIFNQIAGEHGLTPSVDLSGPTYKVLAQVNQSDLAFLRERARSVDAELWVEGSTLNAKKRADRDAGTIKMIHGGKLFDFTVAADLAMQRTSVSVSGWDVASKDEIKFEADDSALGGELGSDESGASILQSALGDRKESLTHTVPLSSDEAQAAAEAFFRMSARRFLVGRGTAETSADLRVGCFLDLQGLGDLFSGKYHVTEVRHMFDLSNGLRTEFRAERPGIGTP
ncbi:MAG TPA: contractile injection system protein, VgrG/Pvc8 family [Pyrinomonadaceae bacterium]|nr:contractile injection system protein, VgrG/Pvc8 family [Pyrinomonadaceae bacterium]